MTAAELGEWVKTMICDWENVQEIRIRVGRPVLICQGQREISDSKRTADSSLIREVLDIVSGHSLYAYEDEIRQGFLTIEGGHRVGICGTAVLKDGDRIQGETGSVCSSGDIIRKIKDISAINIRLARQKIGCADPIMPFLYENTSLKNTLFVAPPGAGKTTMLRDAVRQISDGNRYGKGRTVSVIDERSEIGACVHGVPQCDLGMRTDVLDRCPKEAGMFMMLRSMSPQVMAVDEIGTREDKEALRQVLKCGCRILATVHGERAEDVRQKPILSEMIEEGMFTRIVVLKNEPLPGTLEGIYNEKLHRIDGDREYGKVTGK